MSVSTTAYLGWIKPKGQPWQSVADGDTEAMAWRRLLEHGDLGCAIVLPVGRRPDDGRKRRGRPFNLSPASTTLFAEDTGPYAR